MDKKPPESALKALLSSPRPSSSTFAFHKINPHASMVPQTPSLPSRQLDAININSVKVTNVVSTVNLGVELDLQKINFRTRNSEYNPSRFHGVVMRIRQPRSTALIFSSGKLICTGAPSEFDSRLATRKFAAIIQKLGYNVKVTSYRIQNLLATVDLRFPIRLENLNQMHGQFSSYEPELFPGLIYRMIKPKMVVLVFVNGKLVFTGAKSIEDVKESLEIIYPILQSFRKN